MLGTLRDRIQTIGQTVQNDLHYSLRGLAISPEAKEEVRNKLGLYRKGHKFKVNPNSGSDLLQRYQNQWQGIHESNERNARIAEEIANTINDIEVKSKKQDSIMDELLSQLSRLPQMVESIDSVEKELLKSKRYFLQMEQILTNFEKNREEEEFQKSKLEQHLSVEVYKDGRVTELEALKVRLAVEHTHRVQEFERQQQSVLKERQEAFQMAFEDQLNRYKTEGKVDRKECKDLNRKTTSIEEIVIETEKSEEVALEEFLQS